MNVLKYRMLKRRALNWYDSWKYQACIYKLSRKKYALLGYQAGYRAGLAEGKVQK